MERVLVIGATGTVGSEVVLQLARRGVRVRALSRNPDVSRFPSSVEPVSGDLTRPDSIEAALHGVDAVFLVWTAAGAAVDPVLKRIAKATQRIVYLSAPLKTPHPLFQQPNPSRALAETIEKTIESSRIEWTILRPGMFAANCLEWWAPQIRAGDVVQWPHLSVPTAPIDEHDIAAVAVRALSEEGHDREEYVLTGPQSLSHREQIETIGRVLGRALEIVELTPDAARKELLHTMPGFVIDMLLNAWAAAAGQPAYVSTTVAEIAGTPARSFKDWVVSNAGRFQQLQAVSRG